MRCGRRFLIGLAAFGLTISAVVCRGADYAKAPLDIECALIFNALAFNRSLSGDITLHVLGSEEAAKEFEKARGLTVGAATLSKVTHGDELPDEVPEVLYVGDAGLLSVAIEYTRKHGILSVGKPDFIKKGVSLGVALKGGKPRILLNAAASRAERVNWSPVVVKVADQI